MLLLLIARIASPDVLKHCKVHTPVDSRLLFLPISSSYPPPRLRLLPLPIIPNACAPVGLFETHGVMDVTPVPDRVPPELPPMLCTSPHVHVPLSSLSPGELSPIGALTPTQGPCPSSSSPSTLPKCCKSVEARRVADQQACSNESFNDLIMVMARFMLCSPTAPRALQRKRREAVNAPVPPQGKNPPLYRLITVWVNRCR